MLIGFERDPLLQPPLSAHVFSLLTSVENIVLRVCPVQRQAVGV